MYACVCCSSNDTWLLSLIVKKRKYIVIKVTAQLTSIMSQSVRWITSGCELTSILLSNSVYPLFRSDADDDDVVGMIRTFAAVGQTGVRGEAVPFNGTFVEGNLLTLLREWESLSPAHSPPALIVWLFMQGQSESNLEFKCFLPLFYASPIQSNDECTIYPYHYAS